MGSAFAGSIGELKLDVEAKMQAEQALDRVETQPPAAETVDTNEYSPAG